MENGLKPILHSLLAVYTLSMTASDFDLSNMQLEIELIKR
jgi:hypothetical protein